MDYCFLGPQVIENQRNFKTTNTGSHFRFAAICLLCFNRGVLTGRVSNSPVIYYLVLIAQSASFLNRLIRKITNCYLVSGPLSSVQPSFCPI